MCPSSPITRVIVVTLVLDPEEGKVSEETTTEEEEAEVSTKKSNSDKCVDILVEIH